MDTAAGCGRWIHPTCAPLAIESNGPFVALADGTLLTIDADAVRTSADDGRTWADAWPARFGQHPREPASYHLVRTQNGTLVMVFLEIADYAFSWNDEAGEPGPGCRLELWSVRSLDGGRTWGPRQRLLDGYNANFFSLIETRAGRLLFAIHHLVPDPGRWVVCSFGSDDDGLTWRRSNWLDLGGHGHHDGATEPTLAELGDGRILMLIRTNLDRFWEALSEDGGRTWRTIRPSSIDASSSPGCLRRLASGRLLLVWNRLNPEGRVWDKTPGGQASEFPASWHREELSAMLSDDDGLTWTPPRVIARQPGGQLSYPYVFERRPGELWIFAGFAFTDGWKNPLPLRLCVRETSLLTTTPR